MLVLVIRRRDRCEDEGLVGWCPRTSVCEFRFEDNLFLSTGRARLYQFYRGGRLEDLGGDIPGEGIETFCGLIIESVVVGRGLGNEGPIAIERTCIGIEWTTVRLTETPHQVGHTTGRGAGG